MVQHNVCMWTYIVNNCSIEHGIASLCWFSVGWNGFVYVLKGKGEFGKTVFLCTTEPLLYWSEKLRLSGGENVHWTESNAHHTLVLGPGDHVEAKNTVHELTQRPYYAHELISYCLLLIDATTGRWVAALCPNCWGTSEWANSSAW